MYDAVGYVGVAVAVVLIGAISATRIYLGAHYPMDVLGGWMAGGALVAIIVAVNVMRVDERLRVREAAEASARPRERRVAVPLGDRSRRVKTTSKSTDAPAER